MFSDKSLYLWKGTHPVLFVIIKLIVIDCLMFSGKIAIQEKERAAMKEQNFVRNFLENH